MNTLPLDLLAFGAILSGLLVITSRNPIISVLFLISVFVNVAGYLVLLGISFIGITYLIIYVGAIAILFLFVVMMMNIKLAELTDVTWDYTKNIPLAFLIALLFNIVVVNNVSFTNAISHSTNVLLPNILDILNFSNIGGNQVSLIPLKAVQGLTNIGLYNYIYSWDNLFVTFLHIQGIGFNLYSSHSIYLLLIGVILLMAMIGPIVLTHRPTDQINIL